MSSSSSDLYKADGGPKARMMDLPDELILLIFDKKSISNELLYTLSQVCRRLHDLCLSICFMRFGIKSPQKQAKLTLIDNPLRIDGLSILRITLNVTSLERLVLKLPACDDGLRSLAYHVDRASSLITRLQSVSKVILVFNSDACCCCAKDGTKLKLENELLKIWSSAMGRLMNTIVERSCTSVVLKGGRYLGHLFAFRRRTSQNKFLNPIEAIKSFFTSTRSGELIEEVKRPPRVTKGETWEFKRSEKTRVPMVLTDVTPTAREATQLRSITIQSMMFLMPPLLQWTISAMRYSKIECITLGSLSINHKCWPAIFDLLEIAAPDLTDVSIGKVRQIDPPDLLKFLGRFPKLTSITINHEVENYDGLSMGVFPDFPRLISLHAPAPWVFKLLSSQQRGLGCLEYLCITYRLRNDGLSHWLRQGPIPTIPSLLSDQLRPLTLCLEVRLGDSPAWKMFEDLNASPVGDQKPCLELVSSITLLVEVEFVKEDMPFTTILPRWLIMFPGLRFLVITGHNAAIDKPEMFDTLVRTVQAKKLQLQSLDINGKEAEFVRKPSKGTSS